MLDSSEISTETGKRSRFPRPELEISFSPLQPDRFALKRQGEDSAITVKISRPTRKRKSGEMEKVRNEIHGGGLENGSQFTQIRTECCDWNDFQSSCG